MNERNTEKTEEQDKEKQTNQNIIEDNMSEKGFPVFANRA